MEMTSKERVIAAIQLEEPDRVPVVPMMREFVLKHQHLKFIQCYNDADSYVNAQLKCLRETGVDAVWDLFGIPVLEEAGGSEMATPIDEPPTITNPVLKSRDFNLIKPFNPTSSGRMPHLIEIVKKLKKAVVSEVPVFAWVSAPYRSACMLRGLQNLFIDMYEDPKFVEDLCEYCVKPCVDFAFALAEAGADVIEIGNASASSAMISSDFYRRFVHPTNKKLISALREQNIFVMMHICGDLNDRADIVFSEGMNIMSFEKLDVPKFKEKYGQSTCFLGYVGSSSTLLTGTSYDVENESKKCIEEGGKSGGFILSADCVVPRDTPKENVIAMVNAAKKYGKYPLES